MFAFSHSKTVISFNILLVLLILYLRIIIYFQVSNYNLHDIHIINAVPCLLLMVWRNIYKRQYTDKNDIEKIYEYASERGASKLEFFLHFPF